MQRIARHQARGDTVVVVSASLDVYLRPWCQQHNLELLCSEVEFQNGAATGKYQGRLQRHGQKARIPANYSGRLRGDLRLRRYAGRFRHAGAGHHQNLSLG